MKDTDKIRVQEGGCSTVGEAMLKPRVPRNGKVRIR